MTKTVEKTLNKAYETLEAIAETEKNKDFARKYIADTFDELNGYIGTLYRFGSMRARDMEEAYDLLTGFRIKLSAKYDI